MAPFVVLAVYGVLFVATTPDDRGFGTHEQFGFAPCRLRELLGGPCPTCGVTTSANHVARGAFAEAWQTQPLGVLILGAALAGSLAFPVFHARRRDLGALAMAHGRSFWSVVLVAVLVSWWVSASS